LKLGKTNPYTENYSMNYDLFSPKSNNFKDMKGIININITPETD
jgi:hypothetical protein